MPYMENQAREAQFIMTTTYTFGENVLDVIQQYRSGHPRWYTSSNPKSAYAGKCPICQYDSRTGKNAYFTIDNTKRFFNCYVCHAHGNAYQLKKILTGEDSTPYKPPTPAPSIKPHKKSSKPSTSTNPGATIDRMANARGLDPHILRSELFWLDGPNPWGRPTQAIEIPYADENNRFVRNRYRVNVEGDLKFLWGSGEKVIPYGLPFLEWARESGQITIVEGETDFAKLWENNFPALAVPGTQTWKTEWTEHLKGINDVVLWAEPDTAGQLFAKRVAQDVPHLRVIWAPETIKDPCELGTQAGTQFQQKMSEMIEGAQGYWNRQFQTFLNNWAQYTPQEEFLIVPSWDKHDLAYIRSKACEGYRAGGDFESASRLMTCWVCLKARQWSSGDIEGLRDHCFLRGCPNCVYLRMGQFIEEKQDIFDQLTDPAVYYITLGSKEIGTTPASMVDGFTSLYSEIRGMNTKYTDLYKSVSTAAVNQVYNLRLAVRDGWCAAQIVLLANYEPRAKADIEEFFSKEVGYDVKVEIRRWDHLTDTQKRRDRALGLFKKTVAMEFNWSTTDEFQAWLYAAKRVKLVQGKGVFKKASGGLKPKGVQTEESFGGGTNPFNGNTEAFFDLGKKSPEEIWERFLSEYTHRWHYRPLEGVDVLAYDMDQISMNGPPPD
jgi:5S rRNA maturation endonuclease (ribonuclease M5)